MSLGLSLLLSGRTVLQRSETYGRPSYDPYQQVALNFYLNWFTCLYCSINLASYIANIQISFDPILVIFVSSFGLIFFGFAGLVALYKLFDTKFGLVVDEVGIHDNSSIYPEHLIKWEIIKALRVQQVGLTKFILIDNKDPETYLAEIRGFKKKFMLNTYKRYGTPISLRSTNLKCNFDKLYEVISERLRRAQQHIVND